MLNVFVIAQLAASVMVQVYVPGARDDAVAEVPPEGDHAYVYDGVPPLAVTVAVPLAAPKQETFVCDVAAVIAEGCVIVNENADEHPFASVTVQV